MFLWVSKGENRLYVLDFFVTLIDFNLVLLRGIMSVQYRQNKWQTRLPWLGTDIYTEIQFRGPGLYPVLLHCHYFQPNVYFRAKLATVSALNWFALLYIIGCMTILCVIYHGIHLIMIHTTMSCTTVCFTCQKKMTYIDHFLYLHAVILCFFAYCIYTPCHKHSNHQNNLQAGKRHFFTMWHNNL